MMTKIFLVALVAMMAAAVLADGGPCRGGFWPDGDGCCPKLIDNTPFYRAFNTKCYPREINNSVLYPDSNGYVHPPLPTPSWANRPHTVPLCTGAILTTTEFTCPLAGPARLIGSAALTA
jgi:hypothetical protein